MTLSGDGCGVSHWSPRATGQHDTTSSQLGSLTTPKVEARTCAKTSFDLIFSASLWRLRLDHAGVIA